MNIKCPHCNKDFALTDSETNALLALVRTQEFDKSVNDKIADIKEKYEADTKTKIVEAVAKEHEERLNDVSDLNKQIDSLKNEIELAETQHELDVEKAVSAKEKEYVDQVMQLSADNIALEKQLEFYKDMKTRLTTKAVGESLELHCENEFNKIRATAFPRAEFGKDNEVSKQSGSKGDYIFRDFDEDGMEFLSIMFEMKNETTSTNSAKKRNDSYFAELDKDRREKGCEYAVLVSLLEPESEFYNQGIADVSYAYPKMYVIRPQFFVMLISLLSNVAKTSAIYKKEVLEYKSRNLNLSNFEKDLDIAREGIVEQCDGSLGNLTAAIAEVEKAIGRLEETKTQLKRAKKKLEKTKADTESLTLESLTRDNEEVLKQFKPAEVKESE